MSVVIPAYNCAPYIGRAVESVITQNDAAVEVVVVDDGSRDDTADALARYGSQIHMIRQTNQGVAVARNNGIAAARGEWVAFLDADDVWRPNRLQNAREAMAKHPHAALTFSSFSLVDREGTMLVPDAVKSYYRVFERYHVDWPDILPRVDSFTDSGTHSCYAGNGFESLYLGNFIKTSTVLVRRSVVNALGGFDPQLVTEEDYELYLRIAADHDMVYIDAPLVDVRRRPDQLTSADNAVEVAKNSAQVVSRASARAGSRLGAAIVQRRLADVNRRLAHVALVSGDRCTARQAIRTCLRFGRTDPSLYAMLACTAVPGSIVLGLGGAWRAVRRHLK